MTGHVRLFDAVEGNISDRYFFLSGVSNSLGFKEYTETGHEVRTKPLTKKQIGETVAKIASYFTIVLPIIFLIGKLIDYCRAKWVNRNCLLHEAIMNNDINLVLKYLKMRGVDVNNRKDQGDTPLHVAVRRPRAKDQILRLLLQSAHIKKDIKSIENTYVLEAGNKETHRFIHPTPLELAFKNGAGNKKSYDLTIAAYTLISSQPKVNVFSIPELRASMLYAELDAIIDVVNQHRPI